MLNKRLFMALLLFCNSMLSLSLLYIIYRGALPFDYFMKAISYQEHRAYYDFKNAYGFASASDMRNYLMEHYIKFRYKDILPYCGARVSRTERGAIEDRPIHTMSCLLTGKRDVALCSMESVKYDLIYECLYALLAFREVAKAEDIQEVGGVSFRPNGERNALLLAKFILLSDCGRVENNRYLYGYLLGYAPEDILFFFQRLDYLQYTDIAVPFTYVEFSPQQRQTFDTFVQDIWDVSGRQSFEREKQAVFTWIQEQDKYTNKELYEQIDELRRSCSKT